MHKYIFLVLIFILVVQVHASDDLPRFFEVVPQKIYRGAQPTMAGVDQLAQMKVRTIIDLRDDEPALLAQEEATAHANGMNFVSIPLSGFFAPSDHDMNEVEQILNDPNSQPVFIHCKHGQDRTGLAIGLYRVFYEGESGAAAEKEMLSFGFHKTLLGLYFYFEEKTRDR